MKNAKIPIIVFVLLLLFGLVAAALLASQARFESAYFTAAFQEKFASPEATYEEMWKAQISGDQELTAAALGRRLEGKMRASPVRAIPKIEKISRHKNSAYILAAGWGGSFEKIGGRWVFQNEEVGFYCRQLFRVFGIETAKFR